MSRFVLVSFSQAQARILSQSYVWRRISLFSVTLMEDAREPMILGSETPGASGEIVGDKLLGPITDLLCLWSLSCSQLSCCHPPLLPNALTLTLFSFFLQVWCWLEERKPVKTREYQNLPWLCVFFVWSMYACIYFCLCTFLFLFQSVGGSEWECKAWLLSLVLLASFQPHSSNLAITMSVFIIYCNSTFPEQPVVNLEIK